MIDKIQPTHLQRRAMVYLRQSTLRQVHEHRESTERQYALRRRAVELGWAADHVDVVDEDLGHSGASTTGRTGFARLAEDVAHGRVGAILALEVSRLARCSADWHRLLDLCGLADVVIADEQSVFTVRDYNDRLLLGLKGTMSEAELYWMRLRLEGGRLSKARRGELYVSPPIGYQWDAAACRLRLDADEQVQRAVRLVFERFRLDGSAYAVVRYFERHGLRLPTTASSRRDSRWVPARHGQVLRVLRNPAYAGAYVFGRTEERTALVGGQVRRRQRHTMAPETWKVDLRDRHPAYIDWDQYMANQRKLKDNRTTATTPERHGAAREGSALLQGLALCGRCGRRMATRYPARKNAEYQCRRPEVGFCWAVRADRIDAAVAQLFLDAVQAPEIELGLAVVRETEREAGEIDRQWRLRLEQARYEARLAERRYKAVDPEQRVVARTLEREWNDKLVECEALEREHAEVRRREKVELSDEDRANILALARDLPAVWRAETTTPAERKNLLRMLVREVTLSPVDVPESRTRVQVLWQTGAVNDFAIARPTRYSAQCTPAVALARIRQGVAERRRDALLVADLNRAGLLTGAGRRWTLAAVRRARYQNGLRHLSPLGYPTPERRADGRYSCHGVAVRLGVNASQVRCWVRQKRLVPVEGGGTGHPLWFDLDDATVERLQKAKARRAARRPVARVANEGQYA
jgi:DNA invertase Pin-like site-specific DNA recombinase